MLHMAASLCPTPVLHANDLAVYPILKERELIRAMPHRLHHQFRPSTQGSLHINTSHRPIAPALIYRTRLPQNMTIVGGQTQIILHSIANLPITIAMCGRVIAMFAIFIGSFAIFIGKFPIKMGKLPMTIAAFAMIMATVPMVMAKAPIFMATFAIKMGEFAMTMANVSTSIRNRFNFIATNGHPMGKACYVPSVYQTQLHANFITI